MIWLTWRQFRTPAWVTAGALAALAITLTITGIYLRQVYADAGVATCAGNCQTQIQNFLDEIGASAVPLVYFLSLALAYLLPAVIGIFWGAPLVAREWESGTYRLVWNQSVTRTRWLAAKLGLLACASVASAGLLSLMVSWWASPIDHVRLDRITPMVFGARGITPIGYAVFAFALGVTAGLLLRRTVTAMAVTLVVVAAVQVAMPLWIRPHLIEPATLDTPLVASAIKGMGMSDNGDQMRVTAEVELPGDWVLANTTVTSDGKIFDGPGNPQTCGRNASPQACIDWIGSLHLQQHVTYQPANRYWPLQLVETGILLVLAMMLAGVCFYRIRPRS